MHGRAWEDKLIEKITYKREEEKKLVSKMITIYCKSKHHTKKTLCVECKELDAYAKKRSDSCPIVMTKTFCSNCKNHCYKADMRDKICVVMRFSGPRIIFYHPIVAARHLIASKKEKKKLERELEI